jgi:tripartite-type tricarboxylate transporter receptor subunit TctC
MQRRVISSFSALLLSSLAWTAVADAQAPFYQGKTITVIASTAPGGSTAAMVIWQSLLDGLGTMLATLGALFHSEWPMVFLDLFRDLK